MRADMIVMMPPLFEDNLCLFQGVKSFPIQAFIAQAAIETLVVAVFPRAARLNVKGLYAQLRQPRLDRFCRKL